MTATTPAGRLTLELATASNIKMLDPNRDATVALARAANTMGKACV